MTQKPKVLPPRFEWFPCISFEDSRIFITGILESLGKLALDFSDLSYLTFNLLSILTDAYLGDEWNTFPNLSLFSESLRCAESESLRDLKFTGL